MAQYCLSGGLLAEKTPGEIMNNNGQRERIIKMSGCELWRTEENMSLEALIEKLVKERELFDVTPECQAVFGKPIRAVVSASLHEVLTWFEGDCPGTTNTPMEEMFLDIKKAFQNQPALQQIADINEFLATGKQTPFSLEILQLPDFVVCIIPCNSIKTLIIIQVDEAPEQWGIML